MNERKVTSNPFLTRLEKQGSTGHGNKSEHRLAKKMGSKLQPASGALRGAKSDAKLSAGGLKFRIESKSTINQALSLELSWLVKIGNEAMEDGSIPLLTISFVNGDGNPRSERNPEWVAMPLWAFNTIKEELEEK